MTLSFKIVSAKEKIPAGLKRTLLNACLYDSTRPLSRFKRLWEDNIRLPQGALICVVKNATVPIAVGVMERADEKIPLSDKGILRFMGSIGLYTRPDYRKQGIAHEVARRLERARWHELSASWGKNEEALVSADDDAHAILQDVVRGAHVVFDNRDCLRRQREIESMRTDHVWMRMTGEIQGPRGALRRPLFSSLMEAVPEPDIAFTRGFHTINKLPSGHALQEFFRLQEDWFAKEHGFGWLDGGCWTLAQSLQQWSEGKLHLGRIIRDGITDHIVAVHPAGLVFDAEGVTSRSGIVDRWKKLEYSMGTRVEISLDDGPLRNMSEVSAVNETAMQKLIMSMRKVFGSFEDIEHTMLNELRLLDNKQISKYNHPHSRQASELGEYVCCGSVSPVF